MCHFSRFVFFLLLVSSSNDEFIQTNYEQNVGNYGSCFDSNVMELNRSGHKRQSIQLKWNEINHFWNFLIHPNNDSTQNRWHDMIMTCERNRLNCIHSFAKLLRRFQSCCTRTFAAYDWFIDFFSSSFFVKFSDSLPFNVILCGRWVLRSTVEVVMIVCAAQNTREIPFRVSSVSIDEAEQNRRIETKVEWMRVAEWIVNKLTFTYYFESIDDDIDNDMVMMMMIEPIKLLCMMWYTDIGQVVDRQFIP